MQGTSHRYNERGKCFDWIGFWGFQFTQYTVQLPDLSSLEKTAKTNVIECFTPCKQWFFDSFFCSHFVHIITSNINCVWVGHLFAVVFQWHTIFLPCPAYYTNIHIAFRRAVVVQAKKKIIKINFWFFVDVPIVSVYLFSSPHAWSCWQHDVMLFQLHIFLCCVRGCVNFKWEIYVYYHV